MGQTISLAEKRHPLTETAAAEYLDSATVVAAARSPVEVELVGGKSVDAKLALAMPYQPVIGDELLVIGGARGYWVIGVVSGRGTLELRMPGDIDIHAMGGKLRLGGDKGVDIAGASISLRSKDLRVAAEKVVERFTNVVRNVREMLSVRAGERNITVEGNSIETAKRVTILAQENVAVNGQQIHLG
jgi:hypothetical protein